jgi:hypothetical protein
MTQKKPEGEKYLARTVSIRPDQAKAIEDWPKGQLSRICQAAIDQEIALDSLPDGLRDDALEAATVDFFHEGLSGEYAVIGQDLARHNATEADMATDAEWLGIPPERLLATLQDLFELELEMQLRKRAIFRAA